MWAVKSEMWMTSWDREQNEGCQSSTALDLMKTDKRLHTGQNNAWCTEQAGFIVFGAQTHFEWGNDLETKTIMCDSALPL